MSAAPLHKVVLVFKDGIKGIYKDEVRILSGIKEEQEKTLKNYGNVSGLWGGLAVLIYACIVGIAIPSTLLPYPIATYDDAATKQFLLALFYSELIQSCNEQEAFKQSVLYETLYS